MKRALLILALVAGCGPASEEPQHDTWFVECAALRGIDFRHVRTLEERHWLPEIMGSGLALFDYDADGDLDLYCVQSGDLQASLADQPPNRLFQNQGDGRFVDVTERTGLGDRGYGMGCATGDFDSDGDVDLYVTNVGANVLFENLGDGTFRDRTESSGVGDDGWGTSATFVDFDGDSDLDLFVVNYLEWSPELERECNSNSGQRDYCSPKTLDAPARDVLYENQGRGNFREVSVERGLDAAFGNGLGVATGDYNSDGRVDLYVANDGNANQLWLQQASGRFRDEALFAGCAVDMSGMAEAGMGVVAVDLEQDGDLDLFMTHLTDESNTFYLNEGGRFTDATLRTGLYRESVPFTGFGLGFADFDSDGLLDVYVANGRVTAAQSGESYAQRDQLFRGRGEGRFDEIESFKLPHRGVGRGVALGDIDSDGDVDVCVLESGAGVRLLINEKTRAGQWVRFVVLENSGSAALGARLEIRCGERAFYRSVESAFGYLSAHDPRVHCGLGEARRVDSILVTWADQVCEQFGPFAADREHVLRRGAGRRVEK